MAPSFGFRPNRWLPVHEPGWRAQGMGLMFRLAGRRGPASRQRPQIYVEPQAGMGWRNSRRSLRAPGVAKSADGRVLEPVTEGGVSFEPVPDSPKPAETAAGRAQSRCATLAEDFSAEHHYRGKTWNKLRLLTKPFARYGKPGMDVEGGALYCFAQGTDPEALLMLESRRGHDGPEWQYAFAPMTGFAINAFWKGKELWSLTGRGTTARRGTRPIPFTHPSSLGEPGRSDPQDGK